MNDPYSYIRGMRKFRVPDFGPSGTLSPLEVTEVIASKDTTTAYDPIAMGVALARRDLNVVPSFLPGENKDHVHMLI